MGWGWWSWVRLLELCFQGSRTPEDGWESLCGVMGLLLLRFSRLLSPGCGFWGCWPSCLQNSNVRGVVRERSKRRTFQNKHPLGLDTAHKAWLWIGLSSCSWFVPHEKSSLLSAESPNVGWEWTFLLRSVVCRYERNHWDLKLPALFLSMLWRTEVVFSKDEKLSLPKGTLELIHFSFVCVFIIHCLGDSCIGTVLQE